MSRYVSLSFSESIDLLSMEKIEAHKRGLLHRAFSIFIFNNKNEVGKVLINNDQPFGLIKYLSDHFNHEAEFRSENAIFKIKKPDWILK